MSISSALISARAGLDVVGARADLVTATYQISASSFQDSNSNPPRGATYGLNCWHQSASASASFTSETQPLRITWQVPTGQENSTTGYRLFLGTRSKRYKTIVQVPANPTNSHTLDLAPGKYYVAMSTVGRQGRESSLSGEIAITVN